MRHVILLGSFLGASLAACSDAGAAAYQVGPSGQFRQLHELPPLEPGDIVELEGGASYEGDVVLDDQGAAGNPIIIRGVPKSGQRPVIRGGDNTVEFRGNHYLFENIEVTGGARRCLFHHAHDITVRNVLVRDCAQHGLLGADSGSGSLTLTHSEFYGSGGGLYHHQIYMATDESQYPGSVFRMEFCYVHDAGGGHNVKSRAERNEIYYNWIEGAYYHELELIGPDGQDEALSREDSDVVGNVLRKSGSNQGFFVIRVGGDGTGQSWGRYRFVNNTILMAPGPGTSAVWRIFDGVESVAMHNNAIVQQDGAPGEIEVYRTVEAAWATGSEIVTGKNNWIPIGAASVPPGWSQTVAGEDASLEDLVGLDVRPRPTSPLVDAGDPTPSNASGHEVPSALEAPLFSPPSRAPGAPGAEEPRPLVDVLDIGAFEYGSPDRDPGGDGSPDAGRPGHRPGDGGAGGSDPENSAGKVSDGCAAGGSAPLWAPLLWIGWAFSRARRR